MIVSAVSQPESQLGAEICALLDSTATYSRIVFVAAFVALRTILRLREQLLSRVENGTKLQFTIGIDYGGTSREVLEELLRWNCDTFIFHNTIPRATFHPKAYLFENNSATTLFIGSNNLTDGGLYTNYEVATRYDFQLPEDEQELERILTPLIPFLDPQGLTVKRLDSELIKTLVDRGDVPSEAEARQNRRRSYGTGGEIPPSPFAPVEVPRAPLLPRNIRAEKPSKPLTPESKEGVVLLPASPTHRLLVWRKSNLQRTDALQVNPGSHHVGGIRLTQAKFENPLGQRIDHTTYFRRLFDDYDWEAEKPKKNTDQEHAFVPMRILIRGQDFGIHNFEISHKPSGEAGQDNYTTILKWGRDFTPVVLEANLTGTTFCLYETGEEDAGFLIEITEK